MGSNRNKNSLKTNQYACIYCGEPTTLTDNIPPEEVTGKPITAILSCIECSKALKDKLYKNYSQKKAYVVRWLKRKYRRLLATPDWTEEELLNIKGDRQAVVRAIFKKKRSVIKRINYNGADATKRVCGYCETLFVPRRYWQLFCTDRCSYNYKKGQTSARSLVQNRTSKTAADLGL